MSTSSEHITQRPSRLLGISPAMQGVRAWVQKVAKSGSTLLLRGETGTGKDLVARAIHEASGRAEGPFVVCPIAALPETLIESELFGYERGAFSGANERKLGYVARAQGGTLLLDEIGDLSLPMQVKILRLLQEHEYTPLGGKRVEHANVRFIAATHRDLDAMLRTQAFREDLYYRLSVLVLKMPPLRERRADIPELVQARIAQLAAELGRPALELEPGAMQWLCEDDWRGNVRELLSFVERLVVLASGATITADEMQYLSPRQSAPNAARVETPCAEAHLTLDAKPSGAITVEPLETTLRCAEREAVKRALELAGGNRSLAARWLEIGRTSLYQKLVLHGLYQPSAQQRSAGSVLAHGRSKSLRLVS